MDFKSKLLCNVLGGILSSALLCCITKVAGHIENGKTIFGRDIPPEKMKTRLNLKKQVVLSPQDYLVK